MMIGIQRNDGKCYENCCYVQWHAGVHKAKFEETSFEMVIFIKNFFLIFFCLILGVVLGTCV